MKDGVEREKLAIRSTARATIAWFVATPLNPIFFAAFWFTTSAYRVQSDFIRIQTELAIPFGAGILLAMVLWRRGVTSSQVTLSLFFCILLGMSAGSLIIAIFGMTPETIAPRLIVNAVVWIPASLWALGIVRLIALRYANQARE